MQLNMNLIMILKIKFICLYLIFFYKKIIFHLKIDQNVSEFLYE